MPSARGHHRLEGRHLWHLVAQRAERTPERQLLVDDHGRRITFGEYRDACERTAAGLAEHGITAGSIVSWQLPTWLESVVLVGALARLGAVQNPLLPIYRERELRFITRQLEPSLLVVPSSWNGVEYAAMARSLSSDDRGFDVLVCDREMPLPEGDPGTLPAFAPPASETVRWVFYTSGTTADPKGVKHTDASVIAAALGPIDATQMNADDRSAVVFPLTHIGGVLSVVQSLITGSAMILIESFDSRTAIPVLVREGATLIGAGTPFFLAYLAAQRGNPGEPLFPQARAFPAGGMPKPPEIHYEVKRELGGAGVVSGYGMTECPVCTMNTIHDDDEMLATTEGRATRGVELRVVKLDGTPAVVGEEGELRVKGPQLFEGYVDASLDPEAFDGDGFLCSGDLGVRDEDGYVRITGRVKDIIIRKGENISAAEVENLIYAHPAVADVAVIGVPDPAVGERCCAVVVPASADDPPDLSDLTAYLRQEGLMIQKLPERLELVDELPRNATGKILKHEFRERYAPR